MLTLKITFFMALGATLGYLTAQLIWRYWLWFVDSVFKYLSKR